MSNLDWKVGTRKIQVIDVLELTEAMLHRNIIHGFLFPHFQDRAFQNVQYQTINEQLGLESGHKEIQVFGCLF